MDTANDPIQALIETTGLSCDDLLEKLLQYKRQQSKVAVEAKKTAPTDNCTGNGIDKYVEATPVISEESSSPSCSNNLETAPDVGDNIDEQDASSSGINAHLSINESHQQLPQVLEKSDTFSSHQDTTTENVSPSIGHEKKISRVDLKNTPNEMQIKTALSKPIHISENNKECEEKIVKLKLNYSNVKHQKDLNDPSIPNLHLSLIENNSSLDCVSKFISEPNIENINKSDKNELVRDNDSQNEKEINSTFHHESNPPINNTTCDLSDTVSTDSINLLRRRKSISDELVQKMSERLKQNDEIGNSTNNPQENDIEVCQIEEIEVTENLTKPMLKLRSDLFANNKGNFTPSDNEDENEENTPEMKEFLKNVEEVTGEVENHPSIKCPIQTTCEIAVKDSLPRVRKVKMGFVKKRILHKAIKCINGVEAKKIKRVGSLLVAEKSNSENEIAEEEIRKNLILQLSSLRNKKKSNLISDKCNIDNLIINYDKHTFDKKKAPNTVTAVDQGESSTTVDHKQQNSLTDITDSSSIHDMDSEMTEVKESLFSLSNDTNFVIIDVQGGVEFSEISESVEEPKNTPTDVIKLTKTNDVTKIKGWQNKKFQLQQEKKPKECMKESEIHAQEDFQSNTSMPCCSKAKTIEETNVGFKELSPFVSNSLEEFLTENSTLNISYNIPKSGAVQGITNQKYDTVIIPQSSESTTSESEKKEETEKPKSIKPKTLAEKRRMLENSKPKAITEEKIFNKKSYVLYNGRKLYVPTTNSEKCLMNIKKKPKRNIRHKRTNKIIESKKLSLLDSYHQSSHCASYKPGPLREKWKLQNKESLLQWDTEIRKLPSVKLNVVTEVGKPIPPHLAHHFNFGPIIKEDRLELALSALLNNSGEKQKQGFSLTVPYANNQKYVLVRKKKEIPPDVIYDITPQKNTIESILYDIMSYVENKENENSIIRDAEVYEEKEEKHENKARTIGISPTKRAKSRQLQTEIVRLSCKVLSVSVDETEEDNPMCQKSFCKLGCVCKSLGCVPQLPMHCGKMQCMFECKCSVSENISLGAETGALTLDTVTRLEDRAKKNLARVEKEFTQTIIHANNKTILIPSSDRKKTKRVKRMPKRYSDFLEDFDDEHKSHSPNDNNEYDPKKIANCYVALQKLDLKGIIPLCLYHECYSCSCICKSDKKSNSISENESLEVAPHRSPRKRKCSTIEKKSISKELKLTSGVSNSSYHTSDSDYMEEIKVVDTRKYKGKEGCARILGVHPEIVARNEIPFYKQKIKSKVIQTINSTFIDTTSLQDMVYTEPSTDSIDVTTPLTISASDRLKIFIVRSKQRKRKQTFDDFTYKTKKLKGKETPKEIENLPYSAVFDGEIIVPTNENKDFVKKLGVKSAAKYMRLLPWNHLLKNYYNRKINIWCNDSFNKLLMNIADVEPPQGYIEITESKRKNGIMNWILTKQLPKQTPSELVHLILSPKNGYFEISGICLKNTTEVEKKTEKYIETKKNEKTILEPSLIVDQNNHSNDSKFFEHKNHNNETKLLIIAQREYNKQFLCILPGSEQSNDEEFSPLHVRLPTFESLRWRMLCLNSNFTFLSFAKNGYSIKYTDLKNILKKAQICNKTICLQSKNLSKGYSQKNYGIYAVPKYTDILFIGPYEMDEEHGLQTLRYLRQELVSTTYFEMVQGGVIPNKKKDIWLISKDLQYSLNKIDIPKIKKKSQSSLLNSSPDEFQHIDINSEYAVLTPLPNSSTNTSQENKTSDSECKNDTAQELHNFHSRLFDVSGNFTTSGDLEEKTFVKFPQFTIVNGKTLRPQDYNRYLATNIPNFGYLGAIQDDETNEIEVNWPFGSRVIKFPNFAYARQFLKRRFINLLLPVPVTFNIQIIMKSDMENLENMSPVDSKFLNGTHICGSFGIMDSRKLTPSLALTLDTTQEEVLARLAKRAQYLVRCRLRTLGLFLLPKDEQLQEVLDNVAHLSKLGGLEIQKLKAQEKTLINTKRELILKKQTNLKKYMDLLMTLPEEQRLERYAKFRQEFNRDHLDNSELNISSESQKNEKPVECIEIEDSDSDGGTSLKTNETSKLKENSPKKEISVQSIPKLNILQQPSSSSCIESESSGPVKNFKLVKTSTGKLVLVKDNSGGSLSRTLSGMKMKICNNKVLSSNNK